VKDLHVIRFDLDEDLWLDDWDDPLMVAASLAHAGEWDVDLSLLSAPEAA
jgi:hypothetical protein